MQEHISRKSFFKRVAAVLAAGGVIGGLVRFRREPKRDLAFRPRPEPRSVSRSPRGE